MKTQEISLDEVLRLNDLYSCNILDTPTEQDFDELVDLAALICGCPVALITFVDKDRQWFKAKLNFDTQETSRDISFCSHAIQQDDVFIIENALLDTRFRNNPAVTGSVSVRFYAGAPVYSPNGYKIGTLCVIDRRPKTLLPRYIDALKKLSRQVSKLIELRLKTKMLDDYKNGSMKAVQQ